MKKITINFPELYKAQRQVVKACLSDKYKYVTLNGGRQVGKTFILAYVALFWALNEKNAHIMIVSPTDSQVKKIQQQIIQMIDEGYKLIVKSSKQSSGDAKIEFITGSQILFRSASSENSLRGYSNTHLLVDESAFIKEETWTTILAPTLTVRGKKVLFCSTPKGLNFFNKMYNLGLSNEFGYKSFKIVYHQNPFADINFIEQQKKQLPDEIFRQEYLGEFIDSSSIFKDVDKYATLQIKQSKEYQKSYYIGIDIAFKTDYTVAVCMDQDGKMIDYIRFNQTETTQLVDKLYTFIQKWSPNKTIIEVNNQGLPICDLLRKKQIYNLEEFNTNPSTKPDLINEFMASFNQGKIQLINDEIVKGEFKAFTYTLSKNGKVQFAAAYGHDDIVMATAFAFKAIQKNKYTPLAFV